MSILYVDEETGLITFKNKKLNSEYMIPSYCSEINITQESRLCLPLALFQAAFPKIREQSHAGITIAQTNFNQTYYKPLLQKWFCFFLSMAVLNIKQISMLK